MSTAVLPANPAAPAPAWNEDLIYWALAEPPRRHLLFALAGGPQTAGNLIGVSGRRLDATLKHLQTLREAGLVAQRENPGDGRKYLYALTPTVPLQKTETGVVLDFGFLAVRL